MRILCLDIGTKRIGLAATDALGLTAQPIGVIERRGGIGDLREIERRCRELAAKQLLIGIPLDAEGEFGPAAKKVRSFADRLVRHLAGAGLDLSVEFWDESHSTVQAGERLIRAGVSRAKRKKVIDKMAALVILEDYLKTKE